MPRYVDLGSREEDAPAIFAPGGGQFSSSGAFPSVLLPVVWETCRKISLAFRDPLFVSVAVGTTFTGKRRRSRVRPASEVVDGFP